MPKTSDFPDNQFVPCTILAIDAVGHSRLVRTLAVRHSHDLFSQLEARVRSEVETQGGLLLGWAGDGGVAAFSSDDPTDDVDRAQRALRAADNILANLPALNGQQGLQGTDAVQLRLALHSGTLIWRKNPGSIHSQDVNFVAHLEHALPEDVVGLSDMFYTALPPAERDHCLAVGEIEDHKIYIYARDRDRRIAAKRRYLEKRTKVDIGEVCMTEGLTHFEFRDAQRRKLPDVGIYTRAQEELFMVGVTLASSFKQETANPTLTALRAANARKVQFRLLVLDPEHEGAPFTEVSVDAINETLESLKTDVSAGHLRKGSIEVRGLRNWPHYTGIMIDGDVNGPAKGDLRGSIKLVESLLLRVQCTVPPEGDKAQHFAPAFEYGGGILSDSVYAFVRGFRHYWQTARHLLSL